MAAWVFSLVICLIGLIMYMVINPTVNPKGSTVALHCFWVGLLGFLLTWNGIVPHLRISN